MNIPITINLPDQQSVDPVGQSLENVIVSPLGVKQRFGSILFYDLASSAAVDGIYDWSEHGYVVAVSGGGIFKLSDTAFSFEEGFFLLETGDYLLLESGYRLILEQQPAFTDVSGSVAMMTGNRVIFANYGDWLYMANGGKIQELRHATSFVSHNGREYQCILNHNAALGAGGTEPGVATESTTYWTDLGAGTSYDAWSEFLRYGSGVSEELSDLDAPTAVRWVALADYYLLAIEEGTERIWYSKVAEPSEFDAEWVSSGFLPDDAHCLRAVGGDVFVGGPRSIEVFQNDGYTPWVPSNYGAIAHGVLAPYSFVFCDNLNTFVWVDNNRRVVRLEGRSAVSLNPTLDTFIRRIPKVDDGIADFHVIEGVSYYYLQFPTSQNAVMVNLSDMSWSEFSADGIRWEASALANVPKWSVTILGDETGVLRYVSSDYPTDSGTAIQSVVRSPRIHSEFVVRAPELVLHFVKVSKTISDTPASMTVRWRDDGGDWIAARTITLATDSLTDYTKHLYRLGSYRQNRQYEFNISGLWPYALAKVEQR